MSFAGEPASAPTQCAFCARPATYLLCDYGALAFRSACGTCRYDPAILARFGPSLEIFPMGAMLAEQEARDAGIPTLPLYENGPPKAEAPDGPPA